MGDWNGNEWNEWGEGKEKWDADERGWTRIKNNTKAGKGGEHGGSQLPVSSIQKEWSARA